MSVFVWSLLIACGTPETPPTPPTAPPPVDVFEGQPSSLAAPFDAVTVYTETHFAHDYGDKTTLKGVTVDGIATPSDQVLAALVARWKGYTPQGGRSDAEVVATVGDFLTAWDGVMQVGVQSGPTASEYLEPALQANPEVGPYHPPKVELREIDGTRVAVAEQFVFTHTGRRGNAFMHLVRAYQVSDGMPFVSQALPQTAHFSERR